MLASFDTAARERAVTGGVQDLSAGRALALDWQQDGDR